MHTLPETVQSPFAESGQIESEVMEISGGSLTLLRQPYGLSHGSTFHLSDGRTILVVRAYKELARFTYDTLYIVMNGPQVESILKEPEGLMPNIFEDAEGKPWVRITPTDVDGDKVRIYPLFDREGYARPKPKRELGWSYIGTCSAGAVFHFVNNFKQSDPDRMHIVSWKKGQAIISKTYKLPLPSDYALALDKEGILHGLKFDYERTMGIHRMMDLAGNELQVRELSWGEFGVFPLEMSMEGDSTVLLTGLNSFRYAKISQQGEVTVHWEMVLDEIEMFYNLWVPVPLGNDRYALTFNFGGGKGWVVFSPEKMEECFYEYEEKGKDHYTDLISGEEIEIPMNILSTLTSDGNGGYQIVFYAQEQGGVEVKMGVLSRKGK